MSDLAERLLDYANRFEGMEADLREAASALRASTEGESARVDGGDRRYLKAWVANLERNLAALRPGSLSHEDCEADLEVLRRVIRALEPAPPSSEQGEDS